MRLFAAIVVLLVLAPAAGAQSPLPWNPLPLPGSGTGEPAPEPEDGGSEDGGTPETAPETAPPSPAPVAPTRRPGRPLTIELSGALVRGPGVAKQDIIMRGGAGGVVGRLVASDGSTVAEARASSTGGFQRAELAFAVPAFVESIVVQMGRVPLQLALWVEGAAAPALTAPTAFVAPRVPRFNRTGRRHKGGFGVERVRGTARNDDLGGASGDDTLLGLGGGDRLLGGTGNDRLLGGAGRDELDGFDGDDRVEGGPGDDAVVESRFGDDHLSGGAGNDYVFGHRGHDTLLGGPGDDILDGGSAPDRFDCGPGDDIAVIDNQSERDGMVGCETVIQTVKIVSRLCEEGGTDGPETLLGTETHDVCLAGGGNDDVEGRHGDDRIDGGAGDDRLFGRFGRDVMEGGEGDDELEGGRDADVLSGGPGDDHLNGGYSGDRVSGGAGEDTIVSQGGGRDYVDCGPGRDLVFADKSDVLRGCETIRRPR